MLLASSSPASSFPKGIIAFLFLIPLSETEYSIITVSDCLDLWFPILRDFLLERDCVLHVSFFDLFFYDFLFLNSRA